MWVAFVSLAALSQPALARDRHDSPPTVETNDLEAQLAALPRLPASQRKVVTIYEFRSGVPGVMNQALTDMFTNALVKSGQFLVAERQRLTPDIATEKTLNGTGKTTGETAQHKLAAAQYIFEGAVSEANQDAQSNSGGFSLGGMSVGRQHQKGQIAIDVRVLDVDTGLVLDSVTITKDVHSGGSSVSGIGSLAQSASNLAGGPAIPLSPDANVQSSHNEGIDRALRECIDAAVLELARRYGHVG
jgi:curli biogenesis system outer membrane secretion channel CsgG